MAIIREPGSYRDNLAVLEEALALYRKGWRDEAREVLAALQTHIDGSPDPKSKVLLPRLAVAQALCSKARPKTSAFRRAVRAVSRLLVTALDRRALGRAEHTIYQMLAVLVSLLIAIEIVSRHL